MDALLPLCLPSIGRDSLHGFRTKQHARQVSHHLSQQIPGSMMRQADRPDDQSLRLRSIENQMNPPPVPS